MEFITCTHAWIQQIEQIMKINRTSEISKEAVTHQPKQRSDVQLEFLFREVNPQLIQNPWKRCVHIPHHLVMNRELKHEAHTKILPIRKRLRNDQPVRESYTEVPGQIPQSCAENYWWEPSL